MNLSNSNPTGCLNDAIRQYNQDHNTDLAELEREVFLARVFNTLEDLIHMFQTRGPGAVQTLYYKHWLHRYVLGGFVGTVGLRYEWMFAYISCSSQSIVHYISSF